MSGLNYRISYPNRGSIASPNSPNPNTYQNKLSQMSYNIATDMQRYSRPEIPARQQIKYNYQDINNPVSMSTMNVLPNYEPQDYPSSGRHSRFPVLINCDSCNGLTMTQIQYQHGCASKTWCFLLLPVFCTGFCCLCMNSCKDVKHYCSSCRKEAGTCKSKCI